MAGAFFKPQYVESNGKYAALAQQAANEAYDGYTAANAANMAAAKIAGDKYSILGKGITNYQKASQEDANNKALAAQVKGFQPDASKLEELSVAYSKADALGESGRMAKEALKKQMLKVGNDRSNYDKILAGADAKTQQIMIGNARNIANDARNKVLDDRATAKWDREQAEQAASDKYHELVNIPLGMKSGIVNDSVTQAEVDAMQLTEPEQATVNLHIQKQIKGLKLSASDETKAIENLYHKTGIDSDTLDRITKAQDNAKPKGAEYYDAMSGFTNKGIQAKLKAQENLGKSVTKQYETGKFSESPYERALAAKAQLGMVPKDVREELQRAELADAEAKKLVTVEDKARLKKANKLQEDIDKVKVKLGASLDASGVKGKALAVAGRQVYGRLNQKDRKSAVSLVNSAVSGLKDINPDDKKAVEKAVSTFYEGVASTTNIGKDQLHAMVIARLNSSKAWLFGDDTVEFDSSPVTAAEIDATSGYARGGSKKDSNKTSALREQLATLTAKYNSANVGPTDTSRGGMIARLREQLVPKKAASDSSTNSSTVIQDKVVAPLVAKVRQGDSSIFKSSKYNGVQVLTVDPVKSAAPSAPVPVAEVKNKPVPGYQLLADNLIKSGKEVGAMLFGKMLEGDSQDVKTAVALANNSLAGMVQIVGSPVSATKHFTDLFLYGKSQGSAFDRHAKQAHEIAVSELEKSGITDPTQQQIITVVSDLLTPGGVAKLGNTAKTMYNMATRVVVPKMAPKSSIVNLAESVRSNRVPTNIRPMGSGNKGTTAGFDAAQRAKQAGINQTGRQGDTVINAAATSRKDNAIAIAEQVKSIQQKINVAENTKSPASRLKAKELKKLKEQLSELRMAQ